MNAPADEWQLHIASDGLSGSVFHARAHACSLSFAQHLQLRVPPGDAVGVSAAFAPHLLRVATVHGLRDTALWDLHSGALLQILEVHGVSNKAVFEGSTVIVEGDAGTWGLVFQAIFDASDGRLLKCDCVYCTNGPGSRGHF